jgi:hypothetical protein
MLALVQPDSGAPPTVATYIFVSLIGLCFAFFAVWILIALFSDRARSRVHWGRGPGRPPMSRLSLLFALPLMLYPPARIVVYLIAAAAGHENDQTWLLPNWWLFPCIAIFILGPLVDKLRNE